jgi:hypothetical protein
MYEEDRNPRFARFDLSEIAKSFPETAETLLVDTYLTNEQAASARVFQWTGEPRPTTMRPVTNTSMCSPAKALSGWTT